MELATSDHIILATYVVILFVLGLSFSRKQLDEENYLLAARKLSLPAFVMSLVTTWYGAILGVGEFVHGFGVVAWVINGLLWYIVYFLFAFFMAKKLHDSKQTTVADQFRKKVGPKSAKLAAVMTFIMSSPAPYVLSLALLVKDIFGLDYYVAVGAALLISAAYIWVGGFRAVVRTDALQFLFMFLGFGGLLVMSFVHFGGMDFLQANLPETHLTFKGELSLQTIAVWGFIAFWTFVDPNFYQRCYAAGSGGMAKKGILISIFFWFVFDMVTLVTGLYARAAFPDGDPQMSYMLLSDAVFPAVFKGVFLVTILSIIMSTIDSFLFASSTIVSVDFLRSKFKKASLKKLTRVGIVMTLIVSFVLIYVFDSIIGIIYAVGTVGVATMLVPILFVMFGKSKLGDLRVLFVMIITACVSSAWLVEGWLNAEWGWPVYRWGIEPMYIGIGVSLVLFFGDFVWRKSLAKN